MKAEKPCVLYLDNEVDNLICFRTSFTLFYEIATTSNIREACNLLAEKKFSVVIVDYKMADIDVISFIEKVKKQYPDLIFIIVTAYAEIDLVIRAMEIYSVFTFVQKPWDFESFKNTIDRAIGIYSIRTENRQLKKDLQERNLQLEKALEEEKKLNDYKTTFIRNLSHEIRTPLNGILGFASLLKISRCKGEHVQYIDACIRSGEKLLSTFENIIIASEIFSDNCIVKPVWISINDLINEKINELTNPYSTFSKSRLIVVSESAPMVLSDKDKLGISLYQIIQNALKYSGEEMVTVCIEQKADRVIISVTDKGNGMDREIQQKIFQPFYQNDTSTTRKYDGTGLGLFIANSFINMLKGSVNCRSESGPGTIISIDLPVLYS